MREAGLLVPVALLVVAATVLFPGARGAVPGGMEMPAPRDASSAPRVPSAADPAPGEPEETAATLLARFFGLPRSAGECQEDQIHRLKEAAARHSYAVDTLVILLPDPIDSHSRWLFDPIQEAIQRAAAANAYALDRFYIPDWRPGTSTAGRPGRAHETSPGVILFRQLPKDKDDLHRLLVTFLVFETPTQGVHLQAFQQALRFIRTWHGGDGGPLRILGPTFSGSSESLRIALLEAEREGLLPQSVRVISGSATRPDNKPLIEGSLPSDRVRYHATVRSNREMLQTAIDHVLKLDSVSMQRVALLAEHNTAYGQSDYSLRDQDDEPLNVLRIGFPLHISRIRAAASGSRDRPVQDFPAPLLSTLALSLKDEGAIIDQVPVFAESTTSAYVELLLLNAFETLRRERITAVGLLATDARDKLFLSQMLARHCPNIRVFTIDTDLLYAHPDYSTYMRGMIVASSYPLFSANQLWTQSRNNRPRLHFAASFTQGIYNAFQALLHGDRVTVDHLVEYSSPLQRNCMGRGCAPPAWISVNGDAGLWPLEVSSRDDMDYVLRVAPSAAATQGIDRARMRPVPAWATVTLIVLHAGAWLQLIAYLFGSLQRRERVSSGQGARIQRLLTAFGPCYPPSMARAFVRSAHPRRYLLAAFVAMLMLVISADLLWIWAVVFVGDWGHLAAAATISSATVLAILAAVVDIARRRFRQRSNTVNQEPRRLGWMMFTYRAIYLSLLTATIVYLLLALAGMAAGVLFPGETAREQHALFLFNRTVDLTNGVSPAIPVLLLCGALYLWGYQHFRTRGVVSRSILDRRLRELDLMRLRPATLEPAATQPIASVGPSLDSMASLRLAVLLAVVILQSFWYVGLLGITNVSTIESVAYTRFFQFGSMLLQALVAVSIAQFLFVWERTRRRLECFVGLEGVSGPLSEAFARLPLGVRRVGTFMRVPRVEELEDTVFTACTVAAPVKLAGVGRAEITMLLRQPELGSDAALPADLLAAVNKAFQHEKTHERGMTFSDTNTWDHVLAFTAKARLLGFAITRLSGTELDQPTKAWLQRVDDLVAMNVALIVREMGGRLAASMMLTMAMTLMILASHTWYPAQPRQVLLGFSWACIVASVAASVRVLIQMDRNEVISHITGTMPNRTTWDLAFVSKLLLWVVVPLLSLFAAQFPDAGRALLQWLQPIQRALP